MGGLVITFHLPLKQYVVYNNPLKPTKIERTSQNAITFDFRLKKWKHILMHISWKYVTDLGIFYNPKFKD